MSVRTLAIAFIFFSTPLFAQAGVVINEVAWMGTSVGPNEEWIELFNDGSTAEDLTGWTLSDGVSLSITLMGTVGAGEYALLERTDDDTVPSVSAVHIYTGALSNDGRTLTLKRADGSTADQVIGGAQWGNIGGDNTTKETAQRTGSGWVTGAATPGTETADDEEEVSTTNTEETGEEDGANTESETVSVKTSNGSSSGKKKIEPKKIESVPELKLVIQAPKVAYVHQAVSFEVVPSGIGDTLLHSLVYMWNFGDMYTGSTKKTTHIYEYPGEYIVVVRGKFGKHDVSVRHEIKVLPISFSLTRTERGDVMLKNNAKYEVDLGGFTLQGKDSFIIPELTLMKAQGTLTIPKKRFGEGNSVAFFDNEKTLVASLGSTVLPEQKYTPVIPLAKNSAEKIERTETPVQEEKIAEPTETIIQIGNDPAKEIPKSAAGNFFKKLASLLGF